jgi:hypothetical protein
MPSHPVEKGWDFGSVIDLIDSSAHDVGSPKLETRSPRPRLALPDNDGGIRLGSFAKLFGDLGISMDVPPLDADSASSNSDDAQPPSPVSLLHIIVPGQPTIMTIPTGADIHVDPGTSNRSR